MLLLFADEVTQTQSIAWSAVVMALVTGALTIAQMINSRKKDKEKAENERLMIKDKMEFDSQLIRLKSAQEKCKEDNKLIEERHEKDIKAIQDALKRCEEKHDKNDERFAKVLELILNRKEEMKDYREKQGTTDVSGSDIDTKINKTHQ